MFTGLFHALETGTGFAVAMLTLLGALWAILRKVFREMRKRSDRTAKLDQLIAILTPNGGESLADQVKETRDRMRVMDKAQQEQAKRMDEIQREVERTNERVADAIVRLSTGQSPRSHRRWDSTVVHSKQGTEGGTP